MLMQRFFSRFTFIAALLATAAVTAAVTSHAQEIGAQAQAVFGPLIASSCSSSSPCLQWSNLSAGAGVRGVSTKGKGVVGQTTFNSTSSSNGQAGVFGDDSSASGSFGAGVKGLSVRGTGIAGQSTSGDAVFGISTNLAGVHGVSTNNNGVFGDSKAPGASGVFGQNGGGGFGVAGRITAPGFAAVFADAGSTGSIALSASSLNGVGANVIGGNFGQFLPALSIIGNDTSDFIYACPSGTANPCGAGQANFLVLGDGSILGNGALQISRNAALDLDVDVGGNVNIGGQYQKNGTCVAGCTQHTTTSAGRAVVSYVPTQSLPTIDDFGEASLQNGSAYVRLDSAFANVIDQRANYLVFITPEGDSRGLYVTQKTVRGFAVHENMGGHSSLTFSYRIVAKPLGKQEQRLPMVTLPKIRMPAGARIQHTTS